MRRLYVDVVLQRQQRGDQPAAGQLRPFLHHNLQRARRHGLVRQLHVASLSTRPTLQVSSFLPLFSSFSTCQPTSLFQLFGVLQPRRDQKKKPKRENTEQNRFFVFVSGGSSTFFSLLSSPLLSTRPFSSQRREWMLKKERDDNKRSCVLVEERKRVRDSKRRRWLAQQPDLITTPLLFISNL